MYLCNKEFFEMKENKKLIGYDFMMNKEAYPLAEQIIKEITKVNKGAEEWYYTCKGVEGFTTWYFAYTKLEDVLKASIILNKILGNSGKSVNTLNSRKIERIVQMLATECECPFKREE